MATDRARAATPPGKEIEGKSVDERNIERLGNLYETFIGARNAVGKSRQTAPEVFFDRLSGFRDDLESLALKVKNFKDYYQEVADIPMTYRLMGREGYELAEVPGLSELMVRTGAEFRKLEANLVPLESFAQYARNTAERLVRRYGGESSHPAPIDDPDVQKLLEHYDDFRLKYAGLVVVPVYAAKLRELTEGNPDAPRNISHRGSTGD